jgi:hypothetical protein
MSRGIWLFVCVALCGAVVVRAQDAHSVVQQAVNTELAADQNDHSHWLYFEVDRKPGKAVTQWVAETSDGNVQRVVEQNGQKVPEWQQRQSMQNFAKNSDELANQRKSDQHDDKQATEMLKLLPQAFLWTKTGERDGSFVLHFTPNPEFHPPDWESRVFAAMEGEMRVDVSEHRIVSLKGRMIRDVRFLGGLLGDLKAGGRFDVERRKTGGDVWQITETHVHIQGRALLFKNISENEDDVKTRFKELPGNVSLSQAESDLMHTQG